MPGRPKYMARRVVALEMDMDSLCDRFSDLCPQEHLDNLDPTDPINTAWCRAFLELATGFFALAQLALLLCEKAGIEPSGLLPTLDTVQPAAPPEPKDDEETDDES